MIAIESISLTKHFQVSVKEPGLTGALRSFFEHKYRTVEAVNQVSFKINRGELVGFLGPNGAGKTTTLKMLSGLLHPTSGDVRVLGYVPWERQSQFQKSFSMVMGQRTQLWWDLPCRETFLLNQKIYDIPEHDFQEMKNELVELLDLKELLTVPVKKLSLGERMKAELACALLHRPQVLLLDEPTLGLDVVMQKKLRQFIKDYNQRYSATILLTSHYMIDVEELCKRVIIIDTGQILYDGDLSSIVEKYAPDKTVTLSSPKTLDEKSLAPYGRVVEISAHTARIEVSRKEVSQSVGKLLSAIPVTDLSIEELPIEEIIRRVFLRAAKPKPPEPVPEKSDSPPFPNERTAP